MGILRARSFRASRAYLARDDPPHAVVLIYDGQMAQAEGTEHIVGAFDREILRDGDCTGVDVGGEVQYKTPDRLALNAKALAWVRILVQGERYKRI